MSLAGYNSAAFTTSSGIAVAAGAAIEVRRESDGALATIYSDEAGTTGIAQPGFVADSNGRFTFYAAGIASGYSVKVTSGADTYTLHNVAIGTAGQRDVSSFFAGLFNQSSETGVREAVIAAHQSLIGVLANFALAASAVAGALTIATKDAAGVAPAANSPAYASVRSATATSGVTTVLAATAAESLVLSSGSTLGAVAALPLKLWVVLFNDGDTRRLGVINCLKTQASSTGSQRDILSIYPLAASGIASSTAEGGAGAADSEQVFYTGTAVTSKAYAVVGYMEWNSITTPGTWTAPDRVQMFGPGVHLPNSRVQYAEKNIATVITGTTTYPDLTTVPQDSEGVGVIASDSFTPKSPCNALRVKGTVAEMAHSSTPAQLAAFLHRSTTTDAIGGVFQARNPAANGRCCCDVERTIQALSGSACTFSLRCGITTAGTITVNGAAGSQDMAGAMVSKISIEEIAV